MIYDGFCEELTDDNLRYAIDLCAHNPNYKVSIGVTNSNILNNVINFIKDYSETYFINIVVNKFGEIEFSNNSVIYICVMNESIKGRRTNYALVENEVDDRLINAIIRPMQVDYFYRSKNW